MLEPSTDARKMASSSSALSSCLFSKGATYNPETRSGAFIYSGDATHFHEWEFRSHLRIAGKEEKELATEMSKLVDGLRADAFTAAMTIGYERLLQAGGLDELIKAIRDVVFPQSEHEAKVLFSAFTKQGGPLARQNGESMQQFVSRRRRTWRLMKELDPEITLSEGHLADLLLDLCGLSH